MKILVLGLSLLLGCANSGSSAPSTMAVSSGPTAAELKAKAEEEHDRAAVVAFVEDTSRQMQSSIELPKEMTVEQSVGEVVFADNRKVAVVILRVALTLNKVPIREVFLTFVAVKTAQDTWSIKSAFSRNNETEEETNGTEL